MGFMNSLGIHIVFVILLFSVANLSWSAHAQTVRQGVETRTVRVRIIAPGTSGDQEDSLPNMLLSQLLEIPSVEPELFSTETWPASLDEQLTIAERAAPESDNVMVVLWYDDQKSPRLHFYAPDLLALNRGAAELFPGTLVVRRIDATNETVQQEAVAIIAKSVVSGLIDAYRPPEATTDSTSPSNIRPDDSPTAAPPSTAVQSTAVNATDTPSRRLFVSAAFFLEIPKIDLLPLYGFDMGVGVELRYGWQLLLGYLAFAKNRKETPQYHLTIDRHPIIVEVRKSWTWRLFSLVGSLTAVPDYVRSQVDLTDANADSNPNRKDWQLSFRAMIHLTARLPHGVQIWAGIGAEIFLIRPRYVHEITDAGDKVSLYTPWTAQPFTRIGIEYAFF